MTERIKPLILNVDDSDGARYAKTRILQLGGFEVIEAASGLQALEKVVKELPDLVLLDTKLPDLNGFEVCRRIKASAETPGILVLQTSASFLQSSDKIRALEGGADNYLVEPIESEELIANVKALLRLRQAEQRARESEMRFRQIAENINDVFWMFSPSDGRLMYVSPAYENMWQRPTANLADDPLDWLDAVHPDDRDRVNIAFTSLMSYEPYEEEYRLVAGKGKNRWVRDRGYVVKNDAGQAYRIARVTQDITGHKLAEEQLQLADRRKDEFLATLAHELRNPLGPILNSVEMLKLNSTPQRVEKSRAMIERQTRHLIHLVNDLLDISRITQGKVSIRPAYVALKTFIHSAIETVQPFLDSRRHTLSVSLPHQDIWLFGDSTRLSQVIANLLNNAGKYTVQGGKISLQAEVVDGMVHISVIDNGIGIAPEKIGSLFELFVQADHAPDRAQDGLGIGLSIVKNLVHLHRGTVDVSSAGPGHGSQFQIALPVLAARPDATTIEAGIQIAETSFNTNLRILVVDDNLDAVETLSTSLQAIGYSVVIAQDGEAALQTVRQFSPDVIILDIGLPGMNGYELAQALRRLPESKHACLIALSGYGQEKDKQAAVIAGFDAYLVKPADSAQIQTLIHTLVTNKRIGL
jgi:PAS domain S-box-containing protein